MKKHLYSICFSLALAALTTFVLLDTFVISRPMQYTKGMINNSMFHQKSSILLKEESRSSSYSEADSSLETDSSQDTETDNKTADSSGKSIATQGASLIGEYQNESSAIKLYQYRYEDTTVYAADITVGSSEAVKTAFAKDYYGKNVTDKTSVIAEQNQAILAINGDYYGARESGYVIRNGVVFRDSSDGRDLLCIYADGAMRIVHSGLQSPQELVDSGVWQAFCFGPALLQDGQIDVTVNEEVDKAMASNPRTAVGMIEPCHYVFVVSDGRTDDSKGLSLYQLASFLQSIGVSTAYNLDGGGSSTLYFNGQIINYPTTSGRSMKERGVSDIVYLEK